MNIATATPVEIDTRLAALYGTLGTLNDQRERAEREITRQSSPDYPAYYRNTVEQLKAQVAEIDVKVSETFAEIHPLEQEFDDRGRWTRYYLVENNNGHVHTSTHCRTCFPTTRFAWLVDYSGAKAETVTNAAGELSCAECFPNLPAAIMLAKSRIETPAKRASREEREAKAAAKAAKAAENGIADAETGGPLHEIDDTHSQDWSETGWRETTRVVKTWRAARNNALGAAKNLVHYGHSHPSSKAWVETIRRNTLALALKQGRPVEEVRAEITKKSAKGFG